MHRLFQIGHGLLVIYESPQLSNLGIGQISLVSKHFEVGGQPCLKALILSFELLL